MPSDVSAGSDALLLEDWAGGEADDVSLEDEEAGWAAGVLDLGVAGLEAGRNAGDVEAMLKDMEIGPRNDAGSPEGRTDHRNRNTIGLF